MRVCGYAVTEHGVLVWYSWPFFLWFCSILFCYPHFLELKIGLNFNCIFYYAAFGGIFIEILSTYRKVVIWSIFNKSTCPSYHLTEQLCIHSADTWVSTRYLVLWSTKDNTGVIKKTDITGFDFVAFVFELKKPSKTCEHVINDDNK